MYKCPLCQVSMDRDIAKHLRFIHKTDLDEMLNTIFLEISRLEDRISNLCELLEIGEK